MTVRRPARNWSVKCLEGQARQLVAGVETMDPLVTGREFQEWVKLILGTADVRWSRFYPAFLPYLFSHTEFKLLQELSPPSSAALMVSAFGTLLTLG